MTTGWLGRELITLASTTSTNDEVLARARAGAAPGLVVIAETQERGRGRLGRRGQSPAGHRYHAALVPPPAVASQAPTLTLAAAVAVAESVNSFGCEASIKWPNDVLHQGKKLAGILTESVTRGGKIEAIVIGIGVNLDGEPPDELAGIATSVGHALGRPVDRGAFTADLLARLERWIDRHRADGPRPVVEAWKQRALAFGRHVEVQIDGAPVAGRAHDLDDDGALVVARDDGGGLVRVLSGEVTLL